MRSITHALLAAAGALAYAGAAAFGLDDVATEARALARQAWQPAPEASAADSYDAWRDLRFRPERALWRAEGLPFQAQFFPTGSYHRRAVEMFEIVDGHARPLVLTQGHFQRGQEPPTDDATPKPVAGFRLHHPMNRADVFDEVVAFLGASYFRAIGQDQWYGSSARGLAIDTTGAPPGQAEEFPAFTRFWLERPAPAATRAVVHALLDSPRATGAYRFEIVPGPMTEVRIQARLFLRAPVATFGLAPLTSMFFGGENQPPAGPGGADFRPEIHDADGLQVASASGEWLWRPLTRPARPFVTSFALPGLRGFGLMQRDRRFESYEDLEAHYQRRPSMWVEPIGDWGPGRVELLQLPAASEADDNIAAFWVPAQPPAPGQPLEIAWRILWAGDEPPGPPAARVVQTRIGHGFRKMPPPPERLQFHVDFAGPALAALPPDAAVEAVASSQDDSRIVAVRTEHHPGLAGWRMTLDVERRLDRAVELRAFLRHGNDTLTETWTYALPPQP